MGYLVQYENMNSEKKSEIGYSMLDGKRTKTKIINKEKYINPSKKFNTFDLSIFGIKNCNDFETILNSILSSTKINTMIWFLCNEKEQKIINGKFWKYSNISYFRNYKNVKDILSYIKNYKNDEDNNWESEQSEQGEQGEQSEQSEKRLSND